jgi:hypothetical protein
VSFSFATACTDTPAPGSRLQTRSPSPETSLEDKEPSSDSPETLAPTAAPSACLSPQEHTVLAAQFLHRLDITDREPANPRLLEYPVY